MGEGGGEFEGETLLVVTGDVEGEALLGGGDLPGGGGDLAGGDRLGGD